MGLMVMTGFFALRMTWATQSTSTCMRNPIELKREM